MDVSSIDGALFRQLLESGFLSLSASMKAINDLNVFPVPDGDTGTNMKMTYAKGLSAIKNLEGGVSELSSAFARGMLFAARGNSGVLLSQYFKGFADGAKGLDSLTVEQWASCMRSAYHNAYSATISPAEGTILTVAREGIENIQAIPQNSGSFLNFLSQVVNAMRISLDNTPNLLPILKDNGVVDSGGKGLLVIFEGLLRVFTGEKLESGEVAYEEHSSVPDIDYSAFNEFSTLDYGYCTEFILQLLVSKGRIEDFSLDSFISWMSEHGNSLVCFQTGSLVKVHIHTKKPYEVIEYAQHFGEFVTFKMENMALQHNEVIHKEQKKERTRKKWGIVSIAQGKGLISLFRELGSDVVIDGGRTMNTSSSEMIDAFKEANAEYIFLLPDNPNIIMAAKQAADLYKKSHVIVIPTRTIQEGYSALSMLLGRDTPVEEALSSLKEGVQSVKSYYVAATSRESTVAGHKAPKGAFVEGNGKQLLSFKMNRKEAVLELIDSIPDIGEREVLYLFAGHDVPPSESDDIVNTLAQTHPNLEVGLVDGGQPVYDYLIGVY